MFRARAARIIAAAMNGASHPDLAEALTVYGISPAEFAHYRKAALAAMSPAREHVAVSESQAMALHGLVGEPE